MTNEGLERPSPYYTRLAVRNLEIYNVIILVVVIIVSTVTLVTLRNCDVSISEKCGPKYPNYSINITGAEETREGGYLSGGVTYPRGTFWKSDGNVFGCPCAVKPCIRKCCQSNKAQKIDTNGKRLCSETNVTFNVSQRGVFAHVEPIQGYKKMQPLNVGDDHFHVFYGRPCKSLFEKSPKKYQNEEHYLMEDGRIYSPLSDHTYIDQSEYCFEMRIDDNSTIDTYQCLPAPEEKNWWSFYIVTAGMFTSIPCLLCTFVVYAILPHKSVHKKCVMCQVGCLAVAYVTLATLQFPNTFYEIGQPSCFVAGFILQFSFLGSFFWLNAMSFDMWLGFSALRMPLNGSQKEVESKQFLIYSLYSWGTPLLIVAITAFMEYSSWVPSCMVKPQIGRDRCWFLTFDARVLYFYLPIGVLVTINVVMFATTSCRLHLDHKMTSSLFKNNDSQRHNVSERNRYYLYLNLFIVMGVAWVMDVLSFAIGGPPIYWIFPDLFNSLQGVFVFINFVCNRSILREVKKRTLPGIGIIGFTSSTKETSRSSFSRLSSFSFRKPRITSTENA